jgi:transposase
MAVTDMSLRQRCVIEFHVKDGNSAGVIYERLRGVYGDVCMGTNSVRRWVKHFKDGNTDIADQPRCSGQRTSATGRNKQNVDELIRQDRRITFRETAAQLGVGHIAVQEMMEILGYRKFCSRWVPCLTLQTNQKKSWELLSHPLYSPHLALSDYHLFWPLKHHLRGHHYETDEAVQETGRSWLRRAGTHTYRTGKFKILQRWKKCIDRDEDFVEK